MGGGNLFAQGESILEEFQIDIYNEPAYHVTYFRITLISDVSWDAIDTFDDYHPITSSYPGSSLFTEIADNIVPKKVAWRGCWTNRFDSTEHKFGLGLYKIVSSNDSTFESLIDWFVIDWRTSLLPEHFNEGSTGGDIRVYFDASQGKFFWDPNFQEPINKGSFNWAELKGFETNVILELEPKVPNNFNVINDNNYPKLIWTKSYDDFVDQYEIYRKVGKFGFFQKIDTVSGNSRSYVDLDYVVGRSLKLTYKIRAKNGTGATAYSSFTPDKFIYGDLYKNFAENKPLEYSLNQNFPNPFNPTTTIGYSIREDNHVEIKLFNSLGKEVALLVNDYKIAGLHKVNLKGSSLPSGTYFYTIRVGDFSDTKKLILLK